MLYENQNFLFKQYYALVKLNLNKTSANVKAKKKTNKLNSQAARRNNSNLLIKHQRYNK